MFLNPQRLEAAEKAAQENWAKWHRRKKWILWPLKILAAAFLLSFFYSIGEKAGVEMCLPADLRK